MIHYLTAHWRKQRWVDIQLAALARAMTEPYVVHAVLDRIPTEHGRKFASVVPAQDAGPGQSHAANLDALAESAPAQPDDILIFLDSDAWPVVDPMPHVRAGLETGALVAPRREEALGSQQPHPLFCAVRAGTWRELGATWRKGYQWTNSLGQPTTDTGAGVLAALGDRPWTSWLRVNRVNPHAVFFGLYGPGVPVVYHHGAGSRSASSRWDKADIAARVNGDPLRREGDAYQKALAQRKAANRRRSERVLRRLVDDPDYWRRWM